jgi:ribonuclease E
MWRFVLPGAGVVGMTLLLLAGSLASWTVGDAVPSGPSASSPLAATTAPPKPAPAPASEEDAMKLALAALASVPSSSAPANAAGTTLPPNAPVPPASSAPIASGQAPPLAAPLDSTEATLAPPPRLSPQTPEPPAAVATLSPPSPRLLPSPSAPAATSPAPAPSPTAAKDVVDQTAKAAPQTAAGASPSDQADQASFASVESLIHRLRTTHRRDANRSTPAASAPASRLPPGERLATARALLASGQTDQARPLLEAAAAQLLLGSNETYPAGSSAAARVDDALRWLGAGQPARALNLVDAAIAVLDQGRAASTIRADRRFATEVPASGPESGLW